MRWRNGCIESWWTVVDGLPIHARVSPGSIAGTGKPVMVLVHGLVISSRYMIPTAERLAQDYRVLAPDLPGFGLSGKPPHVLTVPELADALIAWMDTLGLDHVVLIGNSLGCQIAVDAAVRYPARVERMVLAGPTMDPHARIAPIQIMRWLIDWTRERPSLALAHLIDYCAAGLRRALHTFRYALADPIEAKLPFVQAPTLVLRGSRDPIVPQYWIEEAARLLPRGRLAVIPGGPHVVNYTTPDAFVGLIREFVGNGSG